ncbi:MAG TPA: GTP-binding protein [Burkholderiales bacterium]|nr:GTP-binding protein [Burkholderiales bacterium]
MVQTDNKTKTATGERPPVSIITGYLGAGKTTLLNRLLAHRGMARAAVIINEFGEIGLDHLLVATPSENTVLLQNGCLCCTVRGDLVETLHDLLIKRRDGGLPPFDRVLIETTGLADPVPVLRTLASEEIIIPHLKLGAVITLVDGVNGESQLDDCPESVKQAAVADCLLVSKADLAGAQAVARLRERLAGINPGAQIHEVSRGEIAPELLFDAALDDAAAKGERIERWLNEAAFVKAARAPLHTKRGRYGNKNGSKNASHDARISSFAVRRDGEVSGAGLMGWLNLLAALKGANLLRVKGIVNVEGRPVAVHAVQSVIHEPMTLDAWPSRDRASRIVFITRDMARAELEATLPALDLKARRPGTGVAIDPEAYAKFAQAMSAFRVN